MILMSVLPPVLRRPAPAWSRAAGTWLVLLALAVAGCAPHSAAAESPRAAQPGAAPEDTAARLAAAVRPTLDPRDLAIRLHGAAPGPLEFTPPQRTAADVGRVEQFRLLDQTQTPNVLLTIDAELRQVTPHGYWYVERGRSVDAEALAASAESFETAIYPTVQRLVGGGRDVGPVTLLHANVPGVAGYFNSADMFPQWVHPESNERPMLYLNYNAVRPGTAGYTHTVSHELAHMFHFYVGPQEDTWVKEGLGELAQELVDPTYRYGVSAFLNQPSTQLTGWPPSPPSPQHAYHYQAGFLFLQYFLQRYGGPEILPALLADGGRGPSTFDAYLAATGRPERFDDVFRDWVMANLVQDPTVAQGQYGYQRPPEARPRVIDLRGSGLQDGQVPQYGTDYYQIGGPARLRFQGAPTVGLLAADPPAGGPFWWSNRGDMLDARLTRPLDLRGVSQASLTFDLRVDTEDDYDYGYVMVSTDGGTRWQPVAGRYSTTANPTGRNLGVGYNGKSGGGAQWVAETVDLSAYAGQQVLVRFEYVTDDSYNAQGIAVARVAVPELGWQDDGSGWTSEGFVWAENAIPQRFAVQLVEYRGDQATVRQVPVDASGLAEVDLPGIGTDLTAAVVAISGLAPITLVPARYTLDVAPLGT
jgi:immune inhibitor A